MFINMQENKIKPSNQYQRNVPFQAVPKSFEETFDYCGKTLLVSSDTSDSHRPLRTGWKVLRAVIKPTGIFFRPALGYA